ncbi:MAG: hypothetical protein KDD62_09225, partial [Bdellovibrionales bacterium]|nr:hypothetical protein [Bdellovibrionales bacterium]
RLEREPIIRNRDRDGNRLWAEADMSTLSLFMNWQGEKRDGAKYLQRQHSPAVAMTRFAMHLAVERSEYSDRAKNDLTRLTEDSYFFEKLTCLCVCRHWEPEREGMAKKMFEHYFDMIIADIQMSLNFQGDTRASSEDAKRLLQSIFRQYDAFEKYPSFVKEGDGPVVVHLERSFEPFRSALEAVLCPEFIEDQEFVARHALLPWIPSSNRSLASLGYDISKIRMFSIETEDGTKTLVSKRLNPVKSIFAEFEYLVSKYAYDNGVACPPPVGLMSCGDMQYFLWEFVEPASVKKGEQFDIGLGKEFIEAQLEELGIEHLDLDERNLILSRVSGSLKLFVCDFERAVLTEAAANRVGITTHRRFYGFGPEA